ncbi:MAG: ATP-binding protein [Dehalococcoidia bacterium]|nr:ATP-binding protein [Dehalococcoidia bacterium]
MDISFSANNKESLKEICSICHGAGFVYPLLHDGETDYRNAVPCTCVKKGEHSRKRQRLEEFSNLGALRKATFDSLSPQGRSGNPHSQQFFKAAFSAAKAFAANPSGWLVLIGPPGSGKTHLAAAIANELISNNQPAFFITAANLLDHLRAAYNPESELTYDYLFAQVRNSPLLILDDLGNQSSTPWAQEKLDQLLSHRFDNELPTVITSGIALSQMENRLHNRLTNETICQVFPLENDSADENCQWQEGLELQKKMTFSSFDHRRANLSQEQQDNLNKAYDLALSFANAPDGWLVFQGVTGCGKTHLAAAIVNFRYQAEQQALFVVVPEILDHLRSTFSPDSKTTYDQLFERIKTIPLLVLDDLGAQSATKWAQEKLYQVINYRYNAQLPTVVTTNLCLEELENRVSSRLSDHKMSTPFNIIVPDYRTDIHSARPSKQPYSKRERHFRQT